MVYPIKAYGNRGKNWEFEWEFDAVLSHDDTRDPEERWFAVLYTNLHNMGEDWLPRHQIDGHKLVMEYEQRVVSLETTKHLAGLVSEKRIAATVDEAVLHVTTSLEESTSTSFPMYDRNVNVSTFGPYNEEIARQVRDFSIKFLYNIIKLTIALKMYL